MTTISIGTMYRLQNKDNNRLWAFYVNCGLSDIDEMMFIVHIFHKDSTSVQLWLTESYDRWCENIIKQNTILDEWELSNAAADIRD